MPATTFANADGSYDDESIHCLECKQPFDFTAGEKSFYDEKGFTQKPKRCVACREKNKTRREARGGRDVAHHNRDLDRPAAPRTGKDWDDKDGG